MGQANVAGPRRELSEAQSANRGCRPRFSLALYRGSRDGSPQRFTPQQFRHITDEARGFADEQALERR
jgi:hypothetical protein